MRKPGFFDFVRQEKYLLLFSVLFFVPVGEFFVNGIMYAFALVQAWYTRTFNPEEQALINNPDWLGIVIIFIPVITTLAIISITFFFAVHEQIQRILRQFALLRLEGEAETTLKKLITYFFLLVIIATIPASVVYLSLFAYLPHGNFLAQAIYWLLYLFPVSALSIVTIVRVRCLLAKQADVELNK